MRLKNECSWILLHLQIMMFKNHSLKVTLNKDMLEEVWHNKKISCISDDTLDEATVDMSLIVPLYNSAKFISKCLDSLLNQDTKYCYEIILVNDGSVDETENLARTYCQKYPEKIRLISQANQGISVARNKGMIHSHGRYIGFIDHDDWVDKMYIEKLLNIAYSEKADIVKCSYAVINNGKTIQKNVTSKQTITGSMKSKLFDYRSFIWGGCYRRELLSCVRFPSGYWYEDMITRILLYQQSKKFCDVGELLYYKLEHDNNASNKVWSNKDYKCLEQVYLPEALITDCLQLDIKQDAWMYQCILLEYTAVLAGRIAALPLKIQKQAFFYAGDVLRKIYKEEFEDELIDKLKPWNRVILNKKYYLWLEMAGI